MISPTDLKYAERLRSLRLAKGINQEQAAQLLGLNNQQVYSKLENGSKRFSQQILNTICSVFCVSIDDLTDGDYSSLTINFPMQNALSSELILNKTLVKSMQDTIDAQRIIISNYEKQLSEKSSLIEKLKKRRQYVTPDPHQ